MIKAVVFYSQAANGDLHVSRGLVRYCAQRLPGVHFGYLHKRHKEVLADLPNVPYLGSDIPFDAHANAGVTIGDTLYINTWYLAGGDRFTKRYCKPGSMLLCFDSLYDAFEDALRPHFGDVLAEVHPSKLLPTIDYDAFYVERAAAFALKESRPIVFVANGRPGSGQAENFDLSTFTREVAARHEDVCFLLASRDGRAPTPNVLFTSDIIGKSTGPNVDDVPFRGIPDVNETAFLSTKAKAIVGRVSGPFTFAMTQENLLRPVTWACFHNGAYDFGDPFWLGSRFREVIQYASPVHQYRCSAREDVVRVLELVVEMVR